MMASQLPLTPTHSCKGVREEMTERAGGGCQARGGELVQDFCKGVTLFLCEARRRGGGGPMEGL